MGARGAGSVSSGPFEAEAHLNDRLGAPEPPRLAAFRIETELVEALKRIYYFAKRVARLVFQEARIRVRPGQVKGVAPRQTGGAEGV